MEKLNRNPASDIKECFREYSLEDKVTALKNLLEHNDRCIEKLPIRLTNIRRSKEIVGVKECLQLNQETPFQTIISELRNTVMNSYWNKEIGKTRYQISNLPVGMNPLEVTFGRKLKSEETMADILKERVEKTNGLEPTTLEMYKKSHNSYLPAEQIKRHYKKPFDENFCFGEFKNSNTEGVRLKRLLTWMNADSNTLNSHLYMNMIHGRVAEKRGLSEELNILSDCPLNDEVIAQQNYLKYINGLRQKFKRRVPEIPFADIYEDLLSLDKKCTNVLPEDKILLTLAKYQIYINETLLSPLLDLLEIRKEKNVKYRDLLNLLNWKYDFPTLPKIEKISSECQHYSTTYNTTIGEVNKIDIRNIVAAGISSEDLDKHNAYSLIFPDNFTKHGLSYVDLSKLRSKEEIRSIFESIGVKYSNDNFDLLWKEGTKRSGSDGVSIEIFRNLLDQYDNLISDRIDLKNYTAFLTHISYNFRFKYLLNISIVQTN
ncbi:EF-hand domain-containing family member B [Xylocopa sonorina]|uniref:EF-hand domain-containing family member B n=1 Tax=Xylocopa sonorina TaxID=1818115 RepID=UPI00403AED0F